MVALPKTLGFDAARVANPDVLEVAREPKPEFANAVADVWALSFVLLPNANPGDISGDIIGGSEMEVAVFTTPAASRTRAS